MTRLSRKPAPKPVKREDGTFAPGHPGGPGRPPGARNKTTMAVEGLLDGEAQALTRRAVELALEGDIAALKLCLERICPPRKDRAVNVELPALESAEDLAKAAGGILAAVAAGALTPKEGAALTGIIETHCRALEVAEFERRLDRLERRMTA